MNFKEIFVILTIFIKFSGKNCKVVEIQDFFDGKIAEICSKRGLMSINLKKIDRKTLNSFKTVVFNVQKSSL